VTLSLDVPRVPDGPAAFDALVAMAPPLTEALGGILVDSQGNPLTAEMIASIRARIVQMQGAMAQQQIVAGSTRALRLFS
jgi:FtsZ-interacting cell division protein ZipA